MSMLPDIKAAAQNRALDIGTAWTLLEYAADEIEQLQMLVAREREVNNAMICAELRLRAALAAIAGDAGQADRADRC